MSSKNKPNKAYLLPHTHWDREWRYPVWKNRMLLVEFFDELLHILKTNPEYRCFLLDGQMSPVVDYLEIMPHRKEEVLKEVKAGRIAVGPWYTLPDLYPVDGECLVRNLLKGREVADQLGKNLNVGYNTFGWGQTAQFPQIYDGFGIDFIVSAKRVSKERAPDSEFLWQSPDGTTVLTTRLGDHARANFYFNAYLYAKYEVNCFSSDFRYSPQLSGNAIHNAGENHRDEDFFMINPVMAYNTEHLLQGYEDAKKATDDTTVPSHRLYLCGTDFSTPQSQITSMINDLEEGIDDTTFVHATLEEYAKALAENIDKNALRVIEGELRDGPAPECSGNALSSRIYLKTLNKKVQNKILRTAEPLSAVMLTQGKEYPKGFIDKAWDYMFKSHTHDSINGVTQDKTANDVENRLNQALEIGGVVEHTMIEALAKEIDFSRFDQDAHLLLVWNPHPYTVNDVVKVTVATPVEEKAWEFSAKDSTGKELMVQTISRDEKAYPVHDTQARPWPYITHRQELYLEVGELPPMGYKVIQLETKKHFSPDHFYWIPVRTAMANNILASDNVLENQHLRIEFQPNGSLNMLHKASGKTYEDLHYFEDSGDVGNYWAYYAPYHNKIYTTKGGNATIWAEDNGPLSATIAVEYTMNLPVEGYESRYGVRGKGSRSDITKPVKILSKFTLGKDDKMLKVRTTIDNTVENHRLRVAFPTGINADYANAAGHFTVDSRPRINQPKEDGSYWPEMQTLPMQSFVDINDENNGFALLNSSITEYEYANDTAGTVYLTLFRAMGNMIVTWWEAVGEFADQKGSQLLREMTFDYAIYPHKGDWQEGEVYTQAEQLNQSPITYQVTGNGEGSLPLEKSFLSISNPHLIFSSLKQSEDNNAVSLRVFNPTKEVQTGLITTGFALIQAYKTDLKEDRQEQITVLENTKVEIKVNPNEIYTLRLEI